MSTPRGGSSSGGRRATPVSRAARSSWTPTAGRVTTAGGLSREDRKGRPGSLPPASEGDHRVPRSAPAHLQEDGGLRPLRTHREGVHLGGDKPGGRAACCRGDLSRTDTGNRWVLGAGHFAVMKDGAIIANSGSSDVDTVIGALEITAKTRGMLRAVNEESTLRDGRRSCFRTNGRRAA